jgi:2-aminoethylphosphonate-pyruvate transaminase
MKSGNNPYLLLTPGPLTTTYSVKETMLKDWCTWDRDYNDIVQEIRHRLIQLAARSQDYTSVLMQGSGTFSVEAAVGTFVPREGGLLVLSNGAYGERIAKIAQTLRIDHEVYEVPENQRHNPAKVFEILNRNQYISHIIMVHCETTTGMLNPIHEVSKVAKELGRTFMVDAMSSFGGIPLQMDKDRIDVLISSANKCIQGVPGFGFVIVRKSLIRACKGIARSLSLDLYDQWQTMENQQGKWRFTSPTHTVRAFDQAIKELEQEGGVGTRYERYRKNHQVLVNGMINLGFKCYLPVEYQSPIITSFLYPNHPEFDFDTFYQKLKSLGFVIYPGKVTDMDTFRIGNIGDVHPEDIKALLKAIEKSIYWE